MSGTIEAPATSGRGWSVKPYPAYKDSGAEWLGEIPAHWSVKRLKRVFRVVNGSTPASGEPGYWDGDIPWVTPEDLGELTGTTIVATRRNITDTGYHSCGTTLVPAGSLVLSTSAPIGHLATAGVDLCTNQGCRSLVFRTPASREYFGADTKAAQMFTLAHELAHLWLGESALTDVAPSSAPAHRIESWCNRVAAELLVPLAALREELGRGDPLAHVQGLARRFKVSALVILRRLLDARRLSRHAFDDAYEAELTRLRDTRERAVETST
jgi:hypothetical protein